MYQYTENVKSFKSFSLRKLLFLKIWYVYPPFDVIPYYKVHKNRIKTDKENMLKLKKFIYFNRQKDGRQVCSPIPCVIDPR